MTAVRTSQDACKCYITKITVYFSEGSTITVYVLTSSSSSMSKHVEDIQGVELIYGLSSPASGPAYTYTQSPV